MTTTFSHMLRSRRPVLAAAVFVSLLLLSCKDGATAGKGTAAGKPPAPGTKVDFQLPSVDGRTLGPRSFPGQVVVVDFWATWCGPCHVQALILEDVYKDYHGKGVQFLAANVGEETEAVRRFVKQKPFSYPVLIDPKDVAGQLGIEAPPTLMVIDKKRKLSVFEAGLTDGDTLRRILHQAGA